MEIQDQIYDFRMENVSEPLTLVDEEKEYKIFTEFYQRFTLLDYSHIEFYRQFETKLKSLQSEPFSTKNAPYTIAIHVLGQLKMAWGYHGSSLYIKYLVQIPDGCTLSDKCEMSGTTQSASTVFDSEKNTFVAQFNFPFEFLFVSSMCKLIQIPIIQIMPIVVKKFPKLYFQIFSSDSWNKDILEGYGVCELPSDLGCHTLQIPTWRPFGDRLTRLKSFFIGGSLELEDLNFMDTISDSKVILIHLFNEFLEISFKSLWISCRKYRLS